MYKTKELLCKRAVEKRKRGDVKTDKLEDYGAGGKVRVERFSDGSSIHHYAISEDLMERKTDQFGEDC